MLRVSSVVRSIKAWPIIWCTSALQCDMVSCAGGARQVIRLGCWHVLQHCFHDWLKARRTRQEPKPEEPEDMDRVDGELAILTAHELTAAMSKSVKVQVKALKSHGRMTLIDRYL